MKDRVGVQMNQLDPVKKKKITKERTEWEAEPTTKERLENYNFSCQRRGEGITDRRAPFDDSLLGKIVVLNQLEKILLSHRRNAPERLRVRRKLGGGRRSHREMEDRRRTETKAGERTANGRNGGVNTQRPNAR